MSAHDLANGMVAICDYFATQHTRAARFYEGATDQLASTLGKTFESYVVKHGVEEFEQDVVERYKQYVIGSRRFTEEQFLTWIADQVRQDQAIIDYVQKRDLAYSPAEEGHVVGANHCWQLPPRVLDLPDDDDVPQDFDELTFGDFWR